MSYLSRLKASASVIQGPQLKPAAFRTQYLPKSRRLFLVARSVRVLFQVASLCSIQEGAG